MREERAPLPPLVVACPLLLPALALAGGAWAAARLAWLSPALLVALIAAAIALGRRAGAVVAWLAFGLLWAHVRWVEPQRALLATDTTRPVEVSGAVAGCWTVDEEGATVELHAEQVRQGERVSHAAGRLRLHLPRPPAMALCGGHLAARGYLRPPHVYANAIETTVGGWSMWVKSPALLRVERPPGALAGLAAAARARLFPPRRDARERPGLGLARALLLGDGGALPPLVREGMRRVGLAHLIAVSGLNVGMVGAVAMILLLRAPRTLRLLGTLAAIAGYALLVGPEPSLLRALLMASALLLGLLLRRLPLAANGLAASCMLLLLIDPSWVDDAGFQLSVAATAGLLAFSRTLGDRLQPLRALAAPLAVTIAAQLATLPWSLALFGRLSAISPLANLAAVPWAGVALTVALAWASARLVLGAAADVLLALLDRLALPLGALAHLPPSEWISVPFRTGVLVALTATALVVWCAFRPRPLWSSAVRLLALVTLLWSCAPTGAPAAPELVMLDVGQGDALLLRDGARALLVDGGGWRIPGFGGRVLVPALQALGIRRLTAAAVTHPDADHCYGVIDLLREVPVAQVWTSPGFADTPCGEGLRGGAPVRELSSGDALRVGRWRLRVLNPAAGDESASDNRRSLVLRAEALGRCAILTGDLDAAGERAILARWGGDAVRCDLLKVAHHGSPSSSISPFLDAVRPRLALVSVGAHNAYGHPARRVLAALDGEHARVLRTDRDGMVRVRWGRPWHLTVTSP